MEMLEPRRLLSAGDHDLSYGDNGFLRMRFGTTPYQFMPGSDPNGAATIISMTGSGRSFMLRKFNTGVPATSAGPAGIFAEVSLPFITNPSDRQPTPARIWSLSGGRTLIEFIYPSMTSGSNDGVFLRLKSDNTLDRSYGSGGWVFFSGRFPLEAAQQGDKLLTIDHLGRIVRITDDGKTDTTFGNGGFTRVGPITSRKRLLVQPDGKILVSGEQFGAAQVFRLTANGQLDPTWGGGDGKAVGADINGLAGMAFDSVGRLVVSGPGGVTRFTPGGLLDVSFGVNGLLAPFADPQSLQTGGELVVSNDAMIAPFGGQRFIRVDENGNYDAAFGRVTVDLSVGEPVQDVRDVFRPVIVDPQSASVQPDGSVLVSRRFVDGRFVQVRIDEGGTDVGPITQDAFGVVSVTGTDRADRISIVFENGVTLTATSNGIGRIYSMPEVTGVSASGAARNDTILTSGGGASQRRVTLIGGAGHDTLLGGDRGDVISGLAGDDSIHALGGVDIILGGDGNDTIDGGDQADHISGEAGRDRLIGGHGHDTIRGGAEGDLLFGQGGDNQLFGDGGNDRIFADDAGLDTLHGNAGDDLLLSRDGLKDLLFGDGGRDTSVADNLDELTSVEVRG